MTKTSPPIRILPMTTDGVGEATIKGVQSRFFLQTLPSKERNGRYFYGKSGLDAEPGTIILFQCESRIIASAVLKESERFDQPIDGLGGILWLDVESIHVFDPVGPTLMRDVWPQEFKRFSQAKLTLTAKAYPEFERRLKGIRSPKGTKSKVLTVPTWNTAQELLQPGETCLIVLTDGLHFTKNPDGAGSSGYWNINPKRSVDRIMVYHKGGPNRKFLADLFIAEYDGATANKYGKFKVKFRDMKLAGTTNSKWQEFAGSGQSPVRYVTGIEITQTNNPPVADEDDESACPEGAEKYRWHRDLERDEKVARKAKSKRLSETGKLECEACDFDFATKYGDRGVGFIEAHHKTPVSQLDGKTHTKVSDLALVCSNCHRMLHRGPSLLSVDELRALLQKPTPRLLK